MKKILIPGLLCVALAGCSNQQVSSGPETGAGITAGTHDTGSNSSTSGINDGRGGGVSTTAGAGGNKADYYQPGGKAELPITLGNLNNPASPLSKRIIYFDYDQASIKPEYQKILAAHGELLKKHPEIQVRFEGHADERGTRDYNVALSERRSKTVQWFLSGKGVGNRQMETIAYGEEKPVRSSSNEQSWAENRRVEIRYPR